MEDREIMRFKTENRILRDLVNEFHSGAIPLPQFQRDYVWKSPKIRNLLDSLLQGFPIGGFYLWRPTSSPLDPKPKTFGKQASPSEFEGYLIDGQQRLTSLEAAFGMYTAEEGEDKGGAALQCFLDLAAREDSRRRDSRLFVSYAGNNSVVRRVESGDPTLIPLDKLSDDLRRKTEEALQDRPGWDPDRCDEALERFDRACQMLDQEVPCTTVYDVSDKEAVEIFNRLNKGGRPLTENDVRAAELTSGGGGPAVDVLKSMRKFVTEERPHRLGFGVSFAFRALVVFHTGSARFKSLKWDWINTRGPHDRSLQESWGATERATREALSFADQRMGWSRRTLLPSMNAVILLAAALDKAGLKYSKDAEQFYRRWLCLTALRGVFQGGVESTLNRFLRAIQTAKREPAEGLLGALKPNESGQISAEIDFNQSTQLWGPATQVMHAWLVSQKAKDWLLSDKSLDVLARSGNLTVHHLFARRVLATLVKNKNDANKLTNYSLLSQSTNSEFGAKPADKVLATLTPDQRKLAAAQFFGAAAGERLKPDKYDEFCKWRAEQLAESINAWLGMD